MHRDSATPPPAATVGPAPGPPPPGGELWEIVGDFRTLLTLPAALALQVAHPAVGAGVADHSVFRTDPWGRAERSLTSLLLWVYGGDRAREEGRRLRARHAHIRGTDTHGNPYRALDPETYAWVHATGFPVMRHGQRYLGRPLTSAREHRLYAEWLQVGRVLGIRDADMPRSVDAFRPYYRRMLAERVEPTPVLRELLSVTAPVPPPEAGPRVVRTLLRALWPVLRPPFLRLRRFVTLGLMPPEARDALALPWSPRQERRLRRFGLLVRGVAAVLPERLRYFPAARRARAEHRAGTYAA
ncbi:oxygenase MpaB family protein [Streptomyces sp. TR02-1]|uniref:oxygenase MpaB family protein n=1 Tax=Streptomyces sp. TR02-1 TaxID=3385977 RepID=UPI00399F2D3F